MSKRLEVSSKDVEMQIDQQIPGMMWKAFPVGQHQNRKGWLAHIARSLGWGQRRTKALFYCEARVVTAEEWKTLNERLNAAKRREREHEERVNEHRTNPGGMGKSMSLDAREVSLPLATPSGAPRFAEGYPAGRLAKPHSEE